MILLSTPGSVSPPSNPLCHGKVHDLFDIVHHAIKHPLDVNFDFASERKTIQALLGFNIGENRLHNGKALRIYFAPLVTVDFVLHRFRIIGAGRANGNIQCAALGVFAIKASRR